MGTFQFFSMVMALAYQSGFSLKISQRFSGFFGGLVEVDEHPDNTLINNPAARMGPSFRRGPRVLCIEISSVVFVIVVSRITMLSQFFDTFDVKCLNAKTNYVKNIASSALVPGVPECDSIFHRPVGLRRWECPQKRCEELLWQDIMNVDYLEL